VAAHGRGRRAGSHNLQTGRTGVAVRFTPCAKSGGEWDVTSGVDGLTILKTTHSAFTGYVKDKLTTFKPATDRILGTRAIVDMGLCGMRPPIMLVCARGLSKRCSRCLQDTRV
jgi:hypothetical protein